MTVALAAISLEDAQAARERIADVVLRTPLVRLASEDVSTEIYLKLENLQPIGSFKLRGASNAIALADDTELASGVYTASAGNMAQGIAWCARQLGVRCRVIVPEHAPKAKIDAIERLGGEVIKAPLDEWWQILRNHGSPGMEGFFVHPFANNAVMAGNGTIALEIFEDLDDVDAIVVPFGGGGLVCGIAAVTRAVNPRTKVYAAEVDTGAPLAASLAAGKPTPAAYSRTFVDGISSGAVTQEMWPLAQSLVAGSIVVTVAEVAAAVKLLAGRARVIAEGAGAASVAAAITGKIEAKRIVCIVSGGNIDLDKLVTILRDEIP